MPHSKRLASPQNHCDLLSDNALTITLANLRDALKGNEDAKADLMNLHNHIAALHDSEKKAVSALNEGDTHRASWREAIAAMTDDEGYWKHELEAFDDFTGYVDTAIGVHPSRQSPAPEMDEPVSP